MSNNEQKKIWGFDIVCVYSVSRKIGITMWYEFHLSLKIIIIKSSNSKSDKNKSSV